MSECQYLVAEKDNKCYIKLIGRSTYMSCANFKRYVDDIITIKTYSDVFIDLTELEFIDSTNLGILAKLTEFMLDNHSKKAVIYSNREDINEIIRSVGFFEAFIVCDKLDSENIDLSRINNSETIDGESLNNILLEAHKTLMGMNEKNKELFSDVVSCLSKKDKK